jgi:hypothetical protein
MSCQKIKVGRVHVLLLVVLWAIHSTMCLILHEHPHELILSCQQLLDADRCVWWRGQWVAMWCLPMSMPVAYGSLGVLGVASSAALVHTIYHK